MKYIWNDNEYTQDQIDEAVKASNTTLDNYLSVNNITTVEDGGPEEEKIEDIVTVEKNPPVETTPTAAGDENGDLDLEDISLESPKAEQEEDLIEVTESDDKKWRFRNNRKKKISETTAEDWLTKSKNFNNLRAYNEFDVATSISDYDEAGIKELSNNIEGIEVDESGEVFFNSPATGRVRVIGTATKNIYTPRSTPGKNSDYIAGLDQEQRKNLNESQQRREQSDAYKKLEKQVSDIDNNIADNVNKLSDQNLTTENQTQLLNDINKMQDQSLEACKDLQKEILLTEEDIDPEAELTVKRQLVVAKEVYDKKGKLQGYRPTVLLSEFDQQTKLASAETGFGIDYVQPFQTLVDPEEVENEKRKATDLYQDKITAELANYNFNILDQETNDGSYKYDNLLKIDDFNNAPLEITSNFANAPAQALFDFVNMPTGYRYEGAKGTFSEAERPYESAELLNETFGPFGFYFMYDEDLESENQAMRGSDATSFANNIRVYYRPEFEELTDKDGKIKDINVLDKISGQAKPKEGSDFVLLPVTNRNPIDYTEDRNVGLRGFIKRGPIGLFRDEKTYIDNTWNNWTQDTDGWQLNKYTDNLKEAFTWMQGKAQADADGNQGIPYFNTDALNVVKSPTPAFVEAQIKEADESVIQINQNTKIQGQLEGEIKEIQSYFKKNSPIIKNLNEAFQTLQGDEDYQKVRKETDQAIDKINKVYTQYEDLQVAIEKADPDGDGVIEDQQTLNRIQPIVRLSNQLRKDIIRNQQIVKDNEEYLKDKEKDYKKAYKKYENRGGKTFLEEFNSYADQYTDITNKYNNLVSTNIRLNQSVDKAEAAIDASIITYEEWAVNNAGRGSFTDWVHNRFFEGFKDSMVGLKIYGNELMKAFDKNVLKMDNEEEWNDIIERTRNAANINFNQKYRKHNIDPTYAARFEESEWGQGAGVIIDMASDFILGTAALPFAPGIGFGLSASGKVMTGIDTEVEHMKEQLMYKRNPDGSIVKDEEGNKVLNPNYDDVILSDEEKLFYKTFVGAGTAILEKVGLGEFKSAFQKSLVSQSLTGRILSKIPGANRLSGVEFRNLAYREIEDMISKGIFKVTVGVGGEVTTEVAQEYWQVLGQDATNGLRDIKQKKFFETPDYFSKEMTDRVTQIAKVTSIATLPLTLIGATANGISETRYNKRNSDYLATSFNLIKNKTLNKLYKERLKTEYANNKITIEAYNNSLKNLEEVEGIINNLPTDANGEITISPDAQQKVALLQLEINNLKKNMSEDQSTSKQQRIEIQNREQAIERVIEEDLANGGMKTWLVNEQINKARNEKIARDNEAIKNANIDVTLDQIGNLMLDGADQKTLDAEAAKIEEEMRKIPGQENFTLDPSQYKLSEVNSENFKVIVYDESNIDEVAKDYNTTPEDLNEASEGQFIPSRGVVLMSSEAAKGVKQHEGFHVYTHHGLRKPENAGIARQVANSLLEKIARLDPEAAGVISKQIQEKYDTDESYTDADRAEEIMAYYVQLKSGNNRFKGSSLSDLVRPIRRMLQNVGLRDVKLNRKNVKTFIDDYIFALESGKGLTKAQERFARGEVVLPQTKPDQTVAPQVTEEVAVEETVDTTVEPATQLKAKSIEDVTLLEAINNLLPDDIDTKEKYDAFIRDERKAKPIIDALNQPGGAINNYIRSKQVSQEEGNQMIENTLFRLFNFNPEETRADGTVVGPQGFGERIFADTRFASMDARKKLAQEAAKKKQEVRQDDEAVREIAAEPQDVSGPETKAKPAPRSKITRDFPEIFDEQLKDEFETSAFEMFESEMPEVNEKDYKGFMTDVQRAKMTDATKKKLGTGKNYEFAVKKLAPKMREYFPIQWFVRMEGQTKPENRIFTNPPRRLTTQAEIDAAMRRDDVYVENTAQGVNLYTFKDFDTKELIDYLLAPPISPTTGKRSGLRGTRKTGLAEGVVDVVSKDVTPSVVKRVSKVKDKIGKISEKVQRDPNTLFAKKGIDKLLKDVGIQPLKSINSKGVVTVPEDIAAFENFMLETFPNYLPGFLINSGTFANNRKGKSQFLTSQRRGEIQSEVNAKQDLKNLGLTNRELQALQELGKNVNNWWNKIMDIGTRLFNNEKWKEAKKLKNEGLEVLWRQFNKMYKADPENAKYIAAIIQTSSANSGHIMRMAGYPVGFETKWKGKRKPEREHVIPANQIGEFLFKAMMKGVPLDKAMELVNDNYFQILINKDTDDKIKAAGFQSVMPDGFFESWLDAIDKDTPPQTFLVRYFHPDVNNKVGPDGQVGINPNELFVNLDGKTKTISDLNNIGSNVFNTKQLTFPNVISLQQKLLYDIGSNKISKAEATKIAKKYAADLANEQQQANNLNDNLVGESGVVLHSKKMDMETLLSKAVTLDEALRIARDPNAPVKKIRVFDFDDTLAQTNSLVFYEMPDGTRAQLTAEEFAKDGARLVEEGAVMDFSDFNIVRDGKRGPLFEVAEKIKAARGNEDLFVLTARAPESQQAIYEFLKSEGLEFKIDNIVGLGNSTPEAKANWIVDKAAEGYNDFYFADDAMKNVKAVKDVLDVVDVKSKVQQAKVLKSKKLSTDFNNILEDKSGIGSEKTFSKAKAKILGEKKGKYKFWIPPSAEDFVGLMYPILGKGKKGEQQMKWIKDNLLDPWAKGMANLQQDRLNLMQDFKALKKSLNVPKKLRQTNSTGFSNEQAVRVYMYTAMGHDIPGLSKTDLKELNDIVANDPDLKLFAEQVLLITKGDGYPKPGQSWLAGTITTDLIDLLDTTKRQKYLQEWQENADIIFSEENLNKLEAIYGAKYREALENMLGRMKSGKNRVTGGNRLSNRVLDYINGSIGTIMFFNTRSAVLQTISAINYVNWSFNNPIQAGKAFANQPQYWKDFMMLMNSDYLRDRRNGQRINISESEILDAAKTSRNKAKSAINYILSKGYLPTQFMDSFAIASGGATFYRNRINNLLKETDAEGNKVYTKKQAEEIALREWAELAEENQQSSRVDKISQQQASDLGRIVLAFANTPMQYARIQKRAFQDLVNGRGDAREHISKIIYYGFVQNLIFNAMQQAVFALGFGDDEEDDEKKNEKYYDTLNGMLDSTLRGLGIGGQAVSVVKNFLLDIYERSGRSRPEYVDSMWKLLQFSPPVSSKISKLRQAAWQFDSKKRREKIFEGGFGLDNPAYEAFAKVVSAAANIPLDRALQKFNNIEAAFAEDTDWWQTVAMLAGWPEWQIKPKDKKRDKKNKSIIIDDGGVSATSSKTSTSKPIIVID
tara:strand:- start:849 stop:10592 length:9744 start_codon:yes stop_codon:yes gene_type:complete